MRYIEIDRPVRILATKSQSTFIRCGSHEHTRMIGGKKCIRERGYNYETDQIVGAKGEIGVYSDCSAKITC